MDEAIRIYNFLRNSSPDTTEQACTSAAEFCKVSIIELARSLIASGCKDYGLRQLAV